MKLLQASSAQIVEDIDNSNSFDNNTYYELVIQIPSHLFSEYEPQFKKIESKINEKLYRIESGSPSHCLIKSRMALQMAQINTHHTVDQQAVERIWEPGKFRLFISHLNEDKEEATKLKEELAAYGVSAFVAHKDIEVDQAWENEIINALRSMQSLIALVTAKFHSRYWPNQEIGVALGLGIKVLSVRAGGDPRGFISGVQAMSGDLDNISRLAENIVEVLLSNIATARYMRPALIEALVHSESFGATRDLISMIDTLPELTAEEVKRLKSAYDNHEVANYGAVHRLTSIIRKYDPRFKLTPALPDDDIPF